LPIVSENVIYAVAAVAWRRPRRVPEPERLLAEALVEQAGLVIELTALRGELEQGGLRAELSARAEGAEALLRVAAEVAGRSEPVGIAKDALDAVMALHDADAGAFFTLESSGDAKLVQVGLPESSALVLQSSHADLILDRPLIITDAHTQLPNHLSRALLEAGLTSLVCVPAVSEGRTIGALLLCHRSRRIYRPHELALIEAFAVQVAGGLRLAHAYTALAAADKQREEFLALIAHELRHPVAAIATVAETLADTAGLNAKEQRALAGLRGQAQSLARLAESVLDIARMETGMLRVRRSQVDIAQLSASLAREHPESERIRVEVPSNPIVMMADAELIGRALDNLMRNALKYSSPGSPVLVQVVGDSREIRIAVIDRGIGVAAEDITRLFQKYGRIVNQSSAKVDGIGLGLYLTRLLIEAHGGTIAAASPGLDQGTTFTITLPGRI
jgi:K+-sensing histidine kinase KdpD